MIVFTWLLLISPLQMQQILDVNLSAFLPQGRYTEEYLTDYFNNKVVPRLESGQPIQIASDGNRIVGFVIFERWDDESYYLAEMAIVPEYQGKGIGKKLVFSILDKDQTARKIILITEKRNKWAQGFYEKIGFKPSPFRHPDYSDSFIGYEISCP